MASESFSPEVVALSDRYVEEARRLEALGTAPKKHHIVPRFYLEAWEREGQLRVTQVDSQLSYPTSADKAARETHFYRLDSPDIDVDELPPGLAELLIGKLEGDASSIFRRLRTEADPKLDDEDLLALSVFLGVQFTRGRRERESLEAMATEHHKLMYGDLTDEDIAAIFVKRGQSASDEDIQSSRGFIDGLNSGEIFVAPQRPASVAMSLEAGFKVGLHLTTRDWVLATAPPLLITCDEPVVCVGGPGTPRSERSGAASAPLIMCPLSPDRMLFIAAAGMRLPEELTRADVAEINLEVLASAHSLAFELPTRRYASTVCVPPLPPAVAIERDVQALVDGVKDPGEIVRLCRPHRFAAEPWRPWPLARVWGHTGA